jgi:hypothetical protein
MWTPTPPATPHAYDGTCQKCGAMYPAIDLTLRALGFGRDDQWQCPTCVTASRPAPAAGPTRTDMKAYYAALAALAAKAP